MVPSPSSPAATEAANAKAALRFAARRQRNAFVAGLSQVERDDLQALLPDLLQPLIDTAGRVAAYHAVGSEIDPAPVLKRAMEWGCSAALPAFTDADAPMIFRSGRVFETGPHGIPQPPHQAKEITPDLILVPLLAVDRHGTRLGQGGGHYDCVLPALRNAGAKIIGVGWAIQRIDGDLPVEAWDVPLDGFVSPKGLEFFR